MMMNGRNRNPFTASQWEELEHQALIFKHMVSGVPIPPDLLFTLKRSSSSTCLDPSLSSRLFSRQPQHVGWNCFQMQGGLGRKVDPEPGRCRRTDGKKWRCSKEAYPDSKYCERHMHRGKNRSRKPVETAAATTPLPQTPTPNINSSITKTHHHHHHNQLGNYPGADNYHMNHPYMYHPHAAAVAAAAAATRHPENTTNSLFDSTSYSQTNTDYSYVYGGLKEEVDEYAFFSEPSGSTMRSFSATSSVVDDDSWQLTPLTMNSSSSSKQRNCCGLLQSDYSSLQLQSLCTHQNNYSKQNKQENDDEDHEQNCYVLGSDIKCDQMPIKLEKLGEPQKTVHRFFDEWPPKQHRDSWLDVDDKSSNSSSVSTTRLSISIPSTSHDFPIFNSRAHNDG